MVPASHRLQHWPGKHGGADTVNRDAFEHTRAEYDHGRARPHYSPVVGWHGQGRDDVSALWQTGTWGTGHDLGAEVWIPLLSHWEHCFSKSGEVMAMVVANTAFSYHV